MGRPRTGKNYIGLTGGEREHQRVLRALGLELDGLVVHHIDGDRRNNSPRNLELMTAREHIKLHAGTLSEPDSFEYVPVICPNCLQERTVQYRCTKRKNFTGLCKSCNGVFNGSYGKEGYHPVGGTPIA